MLMSVPFVFLTATIIISLQAETRAEFAERSVQKLQKEVDRLEGQLDARFSHNKLAVMQFRRLVLATRIFYFARCCQCCSLLRIAC